MTYDLMDMWPVIERAQKRIKESGATHPDQLGWGDTILNIAGAILLLHPDNKREVPSELKVKALSTLFHPDTIRELIRLSEILNATEGFSDKSTIHPNEAADNATPVEGAMDRETFNRLMGIGGLDD